MHVKYFLSVEHVNYYLISPSVTPLLAPAPVLPLLILSVFLTVVPLPRFSCLSFQLLSSCRLHLFAGLPYVPVPFRKSHIVAELY